MRLGAGTGIFVLAVAGAAAGVNAYVGYVPDLASIGSAGSTTAIIAGGRTLHAGRVGSAVVELHIGAPRLGLGQLPAYVYLPPGYYSAANAHRRYPTVYLIHGHPGGPIDWFRAGRVQRTMDLLLAHHLVGPMIVVSPSASPSWLLDTECLNKPGGIQMETYLAGTVPDYIDRLFRTERSRSFRAIGGMSSGAFCALNIGLHHPHRFSVLLASEPFGTPGAVADRKMLDNRPALTWANSPSDYLPYLQPSLATAVFLDAGSSDSRTMVNLGLLSHQLAAHGDQVGYRIAVGGNHTWRTARAELPYSLVFAWRHFGLPAGGSDHADAQSVAGLVALATTDGYSGVTTRAATSPPPAPTPTVAASAGAGPATTPTPRRSLRRRGGRPRQSPPTATATP